MRGKTRGSCAFGERFYGVLRSRENLQGKKTRSRGKEAKSGKEGGLKI